MKMKSTQKYCKYHTKKTFLARSTMAEYGAVANNNNNNDDDDDDQDGCDEDRSRSRSH